MEERINAIKQESHKLMDKAQIGRVISALADVVLELSKANKEPTEEEKIKANIIKEVAEIKKAKLAKPTKAKVKSL